MELKVHPSPSIIVRADATISSCIELMRKQNVGSILVIHDKDPGHLVGIFTERDLLKKFSIIGQDNQNWSRPIRSVMTSPVYTLDIASLDQAAEMMLKYNIRHLPITATHDNQENKTALGVISMRDLFKLFYEKQTKPADSILFQQAQTKETKEVHIITQDQILSGFLLKVVQIALAVDGKCVNIQDDIHQSEDLLLIDLDHLPIQAWVNFLRSKITDAKLTLIIILFSPSMQSDSVIQTLEKVGHSTKLLALKKPLDVFQLHQILRLSLIPH